LGGGGSADAAQKAGPLLPPMGVFNSCEIDTALTSPPNCEQEDLAMRQIGLTWEANFIGALMAHKTGTNSLQAWFAYDAQIGMSQALVVKAAVLDPVNVLTGNYLITQFSPSLANDCGATNNEQIIACIHSVASSVPGFHYMWDIYDEPDCPNQSIGYCNGVQTRSFGNEETLANYIHSIDPTHGIFGVNVGDCCLSSGQTAVTNNLYSWLAIPPSTSTGFDYYPIPERAPFGEIANIGKDVTGIARVIQGKNRGMKMNATLQAFSWYQEGAKECTSVTLCPYPTESQMQSERDQVLYYAARAHQPISVLWWYSWSDITCMGEKENYPGCNASANEAALKGTMTAPFPQSRPSR
jgi:hypothetical protein